MPPANGESKTWIRIVTALFILKILQHKSAYGNQIAEEIKQRTFQALHPNPNFLYPLLRSMEEEGYVTGEWDNPHTRGKKVYTLTAKGSAYLLALKGQVQKKFKEIERKQEAIRRYLFEGEDGSENNERTKESI